MLRQQTEQESEQTYLHTGCVVAGKFKLIDKVGQGSFGMVYKTENLETGEISATKFERREDESGRISLVVREIKVMIEVQGLEGFPEIQFYGRDEKYNYFMQTYLGQNLDQLLRRFNKLSAQTVLKVGHQMIDRLKALHHKNLIHRDLKPDNTVIGYDDIDRIYLIDFGLTKYYRDSKGNHIPLCDKEGLVGTARYASLSAHLGKEQSRKDDLESLGYMLVYLVKGKLPWMNIKANSKKEKYQKILEMKQQTTLEHLCELLPKCFMNLFIYARGLDFTQEPDYNFLKEQFHRAIEQDECRNGVQEFEWEKIPELRKRKQKYMANQLKQKSESKSSDDLERKPDRKGSSFLCVPSKEEPQDEQNKKSRNLSNNISSFGTSKVNNYHLSQLEKQIEQAAKKSIRKDKRGLTMGAKQDKSPKIFIKEATTKTMDRKMAFSMVEDDYNEYDDIDQMAEDEAHLQFRNLGVGMRKSLQMIP